MTVPARDGTSSAERHRKPAREFGAQALAVAAGVNIKRIYDEPVRTDGYRVLVDRVWPRGIKKRDADLDDWLAELAPSTKLRKWFGHDPTRWVEFYRRYRVELRQHASKLTELRVRAAHQRVTLLYGARNRQFNQAVVLKEVIEES